MNNNLNPQRRLALTQAVLHCGGKLYEAEYILGRLLPEDVLVSSRVKKAKAIWDRGGIIEDVVKVLTQ